MAVATATDNGTVEEEIPSEESIDVDQARHAVLRYGLEMGVAIPVEEIISRALEADQNGLEAPEDSRERLLACTGTSVADALAASPAVHGWRQMLGAEHEDDCARTPYWLTLAATGELDGHDQRALERHLESCLPCQALEARTARAERAFHATFLLGAGSPTTAAATPATAAVIPAAAVVAAAVEVPSAFDAPPAEAAASQPPLSAAPAANSGRTPRRIAAGLLVSGVAVLGAGAIAVAALSGGSDRSSPRHPSASTPVAAISTPTRAAAPRAHAKRVRKRPAAAPRHRATPHKKVARITSTSAGVATATAGPTAPSAQVRPTPSPVVTPSPVPPAPTQSASPGSISASQQGGLPAQSAPTQTIGSLVSPPSKR